MNKTGVGTTEHHAHMGHGGSGDPSQEHGRDHHQPPVMAATPTMITTP